MPLIWAPKPALHTQGDLLAHESIEVPGMEGWPNFGVQEDGMVTEASLLQSWKASGPKMKTDFGIVTDVREVQPWKA